MNSGKILSFSTEDAYLGKARIRLVNANEPVMDIKEYKNLQSSTPTVVISIESGVIGILGAWSELEMNLEPGNYKICAYYLKKIAANFLIVLCKTNEDATNDLKSLSELSDK